MRNRFGCAARIFFLAALFGWVQPQLAHGQADVPPVHTAIDENGVDLVNRGFVYPMVDVLIGQPGAGGLAFGRTLSLRSNQGAVNWRDNTRGTVTWDDDKYTVSIGERSERFTLTGTLPSGTFSPDAANGTTLTYTTANGGTFTYTSRTGVVAIFRVRAGFTSAVLESVEEPNGGITRYHYRTATGSSGASVRRLQSVTNNFGYQLHFDYRSENPLEPGWGQEASVIAINNAIDYCDPLADDCTGLTQAWPTATYSKVLDGEYTETVTDAAGRVTTFNYPQISFQDNYLKITLPANSSASPNIIVQRTAQANPGPGGVYLVTSVTYGPPNAPSIFRYTFDDGSAERTARRTNPANVLDLALVSSLASGRILSVTDAEDRETQYAYDSNDRLTQVTWPAGTVAGERYTRFTYDVRGNILTTRQVARSASGLADIVTGTAYIENPGVAVCVNPVTCNLPVRFDDAFGYRTQFTYDANHGGVLTITPPAPSGAAPVGSGVRPQTRFTYAPLQAYFKNAAGNLVGGGQIVLPIETSACATLSSCNGGADETVSIMGYGVTDGSVANNLLPLTVTVAAGDGSLSATTTAAYDIIGNAIQVDGPLPGFNDLTRIRYNAAREVTGVMGPDPDGTGPLLRRATRYTYNADGQIIETELGTTSSTNWSTFAAILESQTTYDFDGRPILQRQIGGGVTHAVSQLSYDIVGRVECATVRMNPAQFAAPPASACTLGAQGQFGPSRITRYAYNDAGDIVSITNGAGTPDQAVVQANGFAANSPLQTSTTDANGNVAIYTYDGFDRLDRIRFPNATGGGTSTTDYQRYTYDAGSRLIQERRRNANLISYTYDNLGRATQLNMPGTGDDVTYGWDNFGRLVSAAKPNHALAYGYDQLSRQIFETSPLGVMASQYDPAGRRTRLTWPDGFYAQYDYNIANDLLAVRENGAASSAGVLAEYTYNNLGQVTAIVRADGAGAATTYAYDTAARLSQLTHAMSGGAAQTILFGYNPAGQAITRDGSNAQYAIGLPPENNAYQTNGLNQYTSVSIFPLAYDANGNLTAPSYSYNALNQLVGGADDAEFRYDAQQRLRAVLGAATTRFLYDGVQMVGEFDASNVLQRRYVPGPGLDNPITWYEGSGTSDRRWYMADDLGSIIALSNASGARVGAANQYDAFGRRGSANHGRFQFAGMPFIPEAGLSHARARAYNDGLGRFMQTDPILWDGGMNLYAYVGNDPLNFVDPLGLIECLPDDLCVEAPRPIRQQFRLASFPTYGSGAGTFVTGGQRGGGSGGNSRPSSADDNTCPTGGFADSLYASQAIGADVVMFGFAVGIAGGGLSAAGVPGGPAIGTVGILIAQVGGGVGTGATAGLALMGDQRAAIATGVGGIFLLMNALAPPTAVATLPGEALIADALQNGILDAALDEAGVPDCTPE